MSVLAATAPGARRGSVRAASALVLIASLQIAVPAFVLLTGGDAPERFGWQMFAKRGSMPTVRIVDERGHERAVDLPPFARVRPELDYSRVLPTYVCDRHPGAVSVTVIQTIPSRERTSGC